MVPKTEQVRSRNTNRRADKGGEPRVASRRTLEPDRLQNTAMEFTVDTLLATVTGAVADPIGQRPPVEDGKANLVPQQPNLIVAGEQGPAKTPVQRMMECASRMEAEDTRYLQAKESRQAAEIQYREAYQRFQICKEEARIQRRRQAAYQILLRAVNEVGADVKEQ